MKYTNNGYDIESQALLNLNRFIHGENSRFKYHMKHVQLVRRYAFLLNKRTNAHLSERKLSYIALAHDLFKERSLDPERSEDVIWNGHVIPQDTTKYVRSNLEVLEEYGLDEYFNSDMQYHALSAGIFLHKELGIRDEEILYPVFFHSCQIIPVYANLTDRIKKSVDIIMLADKLSSNWLRINYRGTEVRVDLDQVVFGSDGRELNYTLGLYLARIIAQGKSTEPCSVGATAYYLERLQKMNPLLAKNCSIKKLGGAEVWPKRNSQAFRTD